MPVPILVSSAEGRGWFVVAEPVGTVKKPERSVRGFFKRLVEIINKKSPKATLIDFHSCDSFDRLSFFFGPFFFLCENRPKNFPPRSLIGHDRRSPWPAAWRILHARVQNYTRVTARMRSSHRMANWFKASFQCWTPLRCHRFTTFLMAR